jgi:hypothetical protein
MSSRNLAAKIGAACYAVWGILHLLAAGAVYQLSESASGMAQGRLQQDAFYLVFFAVAGVAIAVTLNWRNDRLGYWMNAILIAVADIPFVLFILLPGLMPWWPGALGPLLWIAGLVFTTLGRLAPAAAAFER